jgi:hypothetical protein
MGEGIETSNGEKVQKLVELFAIDGFGCKFLALCVVEIWYCPYLEKLQSD